MTEVARALDVDLDVDSTALLDLTKTVAHGVARPAAPLTAFLVGYAAARAGGGPEAVASASRTVEELALRWDTASGAASDTASSGAPLNPSLSDGDSDGAS